VLYDYQDSGFFEFIASQDDKHTDDGYYLIDGKGYWLCDSPSNYNNNTLTDTAFIQYEESVLYVGVEPIIFTAKFYDSNDNEIQVTPQWEINYDYTNQLEIVYDENSISIYTENNNLINTTFELSLHADNFDKTTITVKIEAFI
jgi:hypothetical protein